jgi:hypothetical protein
MANARLTDARRAELMAVTDAHNAEVVGDIAKAIEALEAAVADLSPISETGRKVFEIARNLTLNARHHYDHQIKPLMDPAE